MEKEADRLKRLDGDLALLRDLDAVDNFRCTMVENKIPDAAVVATRTGEALKRFGADPDAVSVDDAAARVSSSLVRQRIVTALDRLLQQEKTAGVRPLLRRVDADPYRDTVRDVVLVNDPAKMVTLAAKEEGPEQPPGFAAFLGESPADLRGAAAAVVADGGESAAREPAPADDAGRYLPVIPEGKGERAGALVSGGIGCGPGQLHPFAADPKLADDLNAQHRYIAACSASIAAAGQSDGAKLDDKERTRLRKQALDWLRADLALCGKQLEAGKPADRSQAQSTLRHWQQDSDLASVRDASALAKLPAEEQKAFTQLWANVAELLKKAETPATKTSAWPMPKAVDTLTPMKASAGKFDLAVPALRGDAEIPQGPPRA